MFDDLINRKKKIAVVGLGYVGLPLAKLLSTKYDVIGFDVNQYKIEMYQNGVDLIDECDNLNDFNITFTSDEHMISEANFIIVTVPTPINEDNTPDLAFIKSSTEIVAKNMPKNSIVVYESTVYPGVTEDVCVPILERCSGYKLCRDFKVGYSPERVSSGKNNMKISDITKIVSAIDDESLDIISNVYDSVIDKGIYRAKSIKVAEAAKITENIQRDVNIALVNELSKIYNQMDINVQDVLDAASTKWNFVKYEPGLVGGHCIGVDPYYLIHQSRNLKYPTQLISTARVVNESMVDYIYENVVNLLEMNDIELDDAKILVCGITFKENCNDIRNSKIINVINKLIEAGVDITANDPCAVEDEVREVYNLSLSDDVKDKFDAVIMSASHYEYENWDYDKFKELSKDKIILIDLKEKFKDKMVDKDDVCYWSL
ncbi:MAG: nucleotide sugar dehydrogenase [Methanosphaera sp.]|nr:nucleotide sugar dehydrogenase [Methanosphaera sp.]